MVENLHGGHWDGHAVVERSRPWHLGVDNLHTIKVNTEGNTDLENERFTMHDFWIAQEDTRVDGAFGDLTGDTIVSNQTRLGQNNLADFMVGTARSP